jgi:hypothetical protein
VLHVRADGEDLCRRGAVEERWGGWPASFDRSVARGGWCSKPWPRACGGARCDPAHPSEESTGSRQIAINYRHADITERQKVMLDFAMKVSARAYEVDDAGLAGAEDAYRRRGLGQAECRSGRREKTE